MTSSLEVEGVSPSCSLWEDLSLNSLESLAAEGLEANLNLRFSYQKEGLNRQPGVDLWLELEGGGQMCIPEPSLALLRVGGVSCPMRLPCSSEVGKLDSSPGDAKSTEV